jgi:hypothetical protein
VNASAQFLNPSEAAKRLGVSAKALRLYEQRGLIAPIRTDAGWRAYGPKEMARAAEIAALRVLGFSERSSITAAFHEGCSSPSRAMRVTSPADIFVHRSGSVRLQGHLTRPN